MLQIQLHAIKIANMKKQDAFYCWKGNTDQICVGLYSYLCNATCFFFLVRNSFSFWWSENPQSRRIHWLSWRKLTIHKHKGGLGFTKMETFNEVLILSHSALNSTNSTVRNKS